MEDNKVIVKCTVNHMVSVNVPSVPFKREWIGKDATQKIDKEILEQIMYDPGVKYMFDNGLLYIEDMSVKQELGLEPEDAEEPVNIIILTDKQKRNILINVSFDEFKDWVDKLSVDQTIELAQYAIDNKILDIERDEYIKDKCGRDIITAVRLMNQKEV